MDETQIIKNFTRWLFICNGRYFAIRPVFYRIIPHGMLWCKPNFWENEDKTECLINALFLSCWCLSALSFQMNMIPSPSKSALLLTVSIERGTNKIPITFEISWAFSFVVRTAKLWMSRVVVAVVRHISMNSSLELFLCIPEKIWTGNTLMDFLERSSKK